MSCSLAKVSLFWNDRLILNMNLQMQCTNDCHAMSMLEEEELTLSVNNLKSLYEYVLKIFYSCFGFSGVFFLCVCLHLNKILLFTTPEEANKQIYSENFSFKTILLAFQTIINKIYCLENITVSISSLKIF